MIWTRAELKRNAKAFLSKHYWKSFLITLVIAITGGNEYMMQNGGGGGRGGNRGGSGIGVELGEVFSGGGSPVPTNWLFEKIGFSTIVFITLGMFITGIVLFMAFRILVGAPLDVGGRTFFLRGLREEPDVGDLAWVFRSKHYLNVVKVMFLRGLYNFLWTLLLVIPGVIKHYEYRMVPYILAEDPTLNADAAIKQSMVLTEGHKWAMFVLDLSFLGWYILGGLMLGIGVFFVHPYYEATYVQLYDILRGGSPEEVELVEEAAW